MVKAKDIVKQMTVEQKALLLTGATSMTTAEFEELGIPRKNLADGPHGVHSKVGDEERCGHCYPSMSILGNSWDRNLVYENGRAIGNDCIDLGVDMILAPGINIKRNMLCGRNFEYVSEDPVLSGELAAGYIKGVQSTGVGTSLKHFAANNQETLRDRISAEIDERTLREIYLRGFEIAVKKGDPTSVMCSYNKLNAIWTSENKWLLTEVLRDDWGYDGFVVSDWGAVHNQCKALMAGLDLNMPTNKNIVEQVKKGLEDGSLSEEQLNIAVERVLKFSLMPKAPKTEYDNAAQHRSAQAAAAGSITLLKNEGNLLPLDKNKIKKVCVVGELANRPLINGQGSAEVIVDEKDIDSPLECLRRALDGVQVDYVEGLKNNVAPTEHFWSVHREREWPADIGSYDAVLLFVGYPEANDSEGIDRKMTELTGYADFYIERLRLANPRLCVVLQTGGAIVRPRWDFAAKALVQMGYAGEGGGQAVADIITGAVNPSGKLSETYPVELRIDYDRCGNDMNVSYAEGWRVGYRYYDEHPDKVWFPFGYGLSYTSFEYSDLSVEQLEDRVNLSFRLTNTGERDGAEIVQVYVGDPVSVVSKPKKELRAFEKVFLKAGESRLVEFTLEKKDFAYYNVMLHDWVVENGQYDLLVAASSQDIRLKGRVFFNEPDCYTLQNESYAQIG